ncbi:MAG: hypothetical protein Q4G05_00950 [Clostridia bacterium]|nr:hypothetical protein [Clostridia bacterium]
MENVTQAMKTAGAVLLFVVGLSIAMSMFTKARVTAAAVIKLQDRAVYYEYLDATKEDKRIVGMETIIPTLYKYYKEDYAVVFRRASGEPLPIYLSSINKKYWNQEYLEEVVKNNGQDEYGNRLDQTNCMLVCSFDLTSEIKRNEPWTQGGAQNKTMEKHLDMFISGGKFPLPSDSNKYIDYGPMSAYGTFLSKYKNTKFVESIGRIQEKENMNEIISSLDSKKIIYYTIAN